MADNYVTNPGSGGTTFRSDDLTTFHVPAVKLYTGGDGVDGGFASDSARIPSSASLESSNMTISGVNATPKFASISVAASGDTALVAAVSGRRIRVLSYVIVADGTVAVRFRNGSTDVTGAMSFVANTGVSAAFCPVGHFETSVNTALNINLSAAIGVRGHLVYIEV